LLFLPDVVNKDFHIQTVCSTKPHCSHHYRHSNNKSKLFYFTITPGYLTCSTAL